MTLIERAKDIYEYMGRPSLYEDEDLILNEAYEQALAQTDNADEIRKVIDMNVELRFPITLLMTTLHKLIELRRRPDELRLFAGYLKLYYEKHPANKEFVLSQKLEKEAEILENISKD